eukprot:1503127-Rhodomonas_salina.1
MMTPNSLVTSELEDEDDLGYSWYCLRGEGESNGGSGGRGDLLEREGGRKGHIRALQGTQPDFSVEACLLFRCGVRSRLSRLHNTPLRCNAQRLG